MNSPHPGSVADDGLDLTRLRTIAAPGSRTEPAALDRLRRSIEDHLRVHDGYVAFSGGKDSLVVLHLARAVAPDLPVVFFDSGLEYPETYAYVLDLARRWSLDLHVVASEPLLLDALAASGLWEHSAHPPAAHDHARAATDLQALLIGEPSRRAHEEFGPGELWGVRADESRGRRMAYTRGGRRDGVITRADGTVAFGPIWNWSTSEVWAYIAREDLPVNPVYTVLASMGAPERSRRVSHLLDGTHLDRGRVVWLRRGWPALFEQLADVLPRLRELS